MIEIPTTAAPERARFGLRPHSVAFLAMDDMMSIAERKNPAGAVETCPGIHLLTESLDRPTLNSLIDSVDCFVSLHRSEGFGLVIAEAMARGKVVVATGWSGNMDFMSAHNALPVDYRLVPIEADAGPYRRGERWAVASPDDAVVQLRRVAADAALRQGLGERARADCLRQLAPEVVGAAMAARLRAIFAAKGLTAA